MTTLRLWIQQHFWLISLLTGQFFAALGFNAFAVFTLVSRLLSLPSTSCRLQGFTLLSSVICFIIAYRGDHNLCAALLMVDMLGGILGVILLRQPQLLASQPTEETACHLATAHPQVFKDILAGTHSRELVIKQLLSDGQLTYHEAAELLQLK